MREELGTGTVRIRLLGGFQVRHGDRPLAAAGWPGRRSAELVQLLALSERRTQLRDQVIEALWPHLDPQAGAANLRKAAHHARQALGFPDAVELRGGLVTLFPGHRVETDADAFEHAAREALHQGDPAACAAVAAAYPGDLLPDVRYEEWTQTAREHLRALHRDLLRRGELWEELVEAEPTDEPAYRELMRAALDAGNRHAAIRWYGRLRTVLGQELGVPPGRETDELYGKCVAGLRRTEERIVGRQVELAHLEAALDAADRGELGLLAVRGPAGIGKSALSRRAASLARERGWTVLTVSPAGETGPYEPLVELIEQLIRRDRKVLAGLPERTRSVLAELTPLASPAAPLDGALTRHMVIGAVRRLLPDGRVVLIVDDAHLADDATVEALLHMTGEWAETRCVLMLAYRPEPARDVLTRGVARLDRGSSAALVDLAPLDRADAAALAQAAAATPIPPAILDKIVSLADGNPFFIRELAGHMERAASAVVAPTIWQAVAARFVDLDEGTTSMLQRLAVTGEDLDTTGVLAVTGLSEDDAFGLLDAAITADVLTVVAARYRFRHELVRQALVEQVPPHRRIAIHRDAARRLAEIGGTPAAIAQHWLAGGRPAEGVAWLAAAARGAVKLGAFADAMGYLDTLLDHAPEHPAGLRLRAEALEALGDMRAPAAYAAAARVVSGPEWHDIRAKQALASVRAGNPAAAIEVLDGVQPATVEGRIAYALALCGAAAMGFADPEVGARTAAETRRLAVESGDPAAILIATWAEAAAAHVQGTLPEVIQAGLAETASLPALATSVFDGQLCVAERLLYGRQPYPEVIAFADALRSEAERLGAARGLAFATTLRGEALLLSGRLDEADADLATGARLHRAIGAATGEAASLQRRAEVAWYRGDPDSAKELLDEALSVARESNVGFHLLDRIYGSRITATADPAAALALVEEAEDAVHGSLETCPGCRIMLAVPAAIAAARAGDLDRAAQYEESAQQLTDILMRLPGWYAALEEVHGHRALATGDRGAAATFFATAADGFRAAGQPLDAQRCATLATAR